MTNIYLQPPKDIVLTEREQETWNDIVSGMPVDWFVSGDAHVIVSLVKTHWVCRDLEKQLESARASKDDAMFGKLLGDYDKAVRLVLTLSTKLRLTQQSRVTKGAAGTAVAHAGSHNRKPWDVQIPTKQ